jgi:hypothetical protein
MNRFATLVGLLVCSGSVLACTAPLVAEFRSTPPLLAMQANPGYAVSVFEDGCVQIDRPDQLVDAGRYQTSINRKEVALLKSEIDRSGVARIDVEALKKRLNSSSKNAPGGIEYYVTDENVVEFRFAGQDAPLRWAALRNDLMRAPDDPDLLAIAALVQTFSELGQATLARAKKVTK